MSQIVRRMMTTAAILVGAAIVLSPFALVIHRLAVFHTVPYDDYAPYLLWLLGGNGGSFPDSPYCYRILSILAAVPIYLMTPSLGLSNTPPELPQLWLRATLALNLLNFLALVGAVVLTAQIAIRRCALSVAQAAVAGGLLFVLAWYTQLAAIDGLALLLITAGIALVERPVRFALLVVLADAANEKVALVLALWLAARVFLVARDRARLLPPMLIALAGLAGYLAAVAILRFPGNEYQTNPATLAVTLRENFGAIFSGRGIALNLLPIAVLAGLAGWAHHRCATPPARTTTLFHPADMVTLVGLTVVALCFTHLYQDGRIVMHAAPLFVIPVAARIGSRTGDY